MNKVLTTFAEKGLFETLDDAKIAEMAEVSVEDVAQARAELAEAKGGADKGEEPAEPEADKDAKKKAAAEKRKATMARKKVEAEAKAADEAAAARAKAADEAAVKAEAEAAAKKAAAANRGPVIVVKPMIAKRANGRSWPLRRSDVYTRDDAAYLREHYPQAIKDYVPKAKS